MYQAAGAGSGLDVQVDVYKPDKSKDVAQSGLAVEIGTTGRYYKNFDADAPGWSVQITDENGGKAVRNYGKDSYDSHGVADMVADLQTAIDGVNTAIDTLNTVVTGIDTAVGALGTDVTSILTGVGTIQSTLTEIQSSIDALESPPMVG
jgi:hypothetical protein